MKAKATKKKTYDYTSTQRAARRAAHLHAVAQANGFATWYKLETAVVNGAVLHVEVAGDDADAESGGAKI